MSGTSIFFASTVTWELPTNHWMRCFGLAVYDGDATSLRCIESLPAAKACQEALFQQGQPATMFYTDDVQADYERMKARGAGFTLPPIPVTGSTIATVTDGCGNLQG